MLPAAKLLVPVPLTILASESSTSAFTTTDAISLVTSPKSYSSISGSNPSTSTLSTFNVDNLLFDFFSLSIVNVYVLGAPDSEVTLIV